MISLITSVTASTKRSPSLSGNKRGTPVTNISTLKCTPLDPLDPTVLAHFQTNSPMELLQCFIKGTLDIVEGDWLVVSGVDYPIQAVSEWYWPMDNTTYLHLILEDIK